MRDAPSLRNVILKEFCELLTRFLCDRISPCPEGHQKLSVLVKCHIPMHHSTKAKRSECLDLRAVFLLHRLCQILIAVLQPFPDGIQTVRPDVVHQLVLPIIVSDRKHFMIFVDQYRLDSGRAKLNPECSPASLDRTFCIKSHKYVTSCSFIVSVVP